MSEVPLYRSDLSLLNLEEEGASASEGSEPEDLGALEASGSAPLPAPPPAPLPMPSPASRANPHSSHTAWHTPLAISLSRQARGASLKTSARSRPQAKP